MFNKGFIKKYISSEIEGDIHLLLVNYQSLLSNFLPIALLTKSFSITYRRNRILLDSFIELRVKDFMIYQLVNNRPKIKLFLQKKILSAGGSSMRPRASGGWGLCPQTSRLWQMGDSPQTPNCLRQLGVPPPVPCNTPTLQISGYAPGTNTRMSSL